MSYEPKPSLPRPIYSPVDHYDVDVATGTVTYHVVTTNGDRIRAMSDEDLALFLETTTEHGWVSEAEWMTMAEYIEIPNGGIDGLQSDDFSEIRQVIAVADNH